MLSEPQFPWYQLPFDLARDSYGNEPNLANLTKGLSTRDVEHLVQTKQEEKLDGLHAKLAESIKTQLATQLATDILTGKVVAFTADGSRFQPTESKPLPIGKDAPNLTAAVGNQWLKDSGFNLIWSPVQISGRDAVNRDRYHRARELGFRYPQYPNAPLKGITKCAEILGVDRQTLTNSLKEYRRDYPNDI